MGGVLLVSTLLFNGCSTKIQVDKKVGTLNLKSTKLKQEKSDSHIIAIISPKLYLEEKKDLQQNQPPIGKLVYQMNNFYKQNGYNVNNAFTVYIKQLEKALASSVSEIISAKGFKLKGPYPVLDDITYQDKKVSYLAFVPKVDFEIFKKTTMTKQHRLYNIEKGVIQVGGSLTISMLEPMTGQVFVKRRINLSDFNIQEPYTYEYQTTMGGDGLIGTALDKGTAPEKLLDTTDIALTKAINIFYAKTIEKINKYLDKEEILSFEKDILKLKGLKRF